jgi:hypothetical protein
MPMYSSLLVEALVAKTVVARVVLVVLYHCQAKV